jgi:hypothetical protein
VITVSSDGRYGSESVVSGLENTVMAMGFQGCLGLQEGRQAAEAPVE